MSDELIPRGDSVKPGNLRPFCAIYGANRHEPVSSSGPSMAADSLKTSDVCGNVR